MRRGPPAASWWEGSSNERDGLEPDGGCAPAASLGRRAFSVARFEGGRPDTDPPRDVDSNELQKPCAPLFSQPFFI
jgi:hypothetical protein